MAPTSPDAYRRDASNSLQEPASTSKGATMMNETWPGYLITDLIFDLLNLWGIACLIAGLVGLVMQYRQWLRKSRIQRWEPHYQAPVEQVEPMGKADFYDELKAALFRQIDAILREMEGAGE